MVNKVSKGPLRHVTPSPAIKARLQVRVSLLEKDRIAHLFSDKSHGGHRGRTGYMTIMEQAEGLTLYEALRLLRDEQQYPRSKGHQQSAVIAVTPSLALLERADECMVSPHVLIRAAVVLLAHRAEEDRAMKIRLEAKDGGEEGGVSGSEEEAAS